MKRTNKNNEDFKVKYRNDTYNIFSFLNNHPGGVNYVRPYENKDIDQRMKNTNHSDAAYYLLKEYVQGGRKNLKENDDLETLVDWNKAMLPQVGKLGEHYKKWVLSPVDRHLRLFENPILENLTITPWYIVPLIWIPVTFLFVLYGTKNYYSHTKGSSILEPAVCVALGLILWTLIEYSLHRWVFHMEPSGRSQILIYMHFAIHGLHHKVPFDSRRLVFPPFPAAILTFLIYKLLSFITPDHFLLLLLAGGLLGYVVYDMIHFYLHYGSPSENSYFYFMKRYHNQHHFVHSDIGFGISSMLWDKVFGTVISLKKLAYTIKW
ncbi:unnamed protein product [Brassicogethes aeneus]|uniref:Fatty acid 2-hydroxylase n=1 Tax=Brassicogethes aeneus TaxID=1431903 RepID=A0A9P0FFM1_BRAAE|nr:unnamed protein product [Brassicogethes aeneus]